MSKDLSSKKLLQPEVSARNIFAAFVTVLGVALLFLAGQVIGVIIVIALVRLLGNDQTATVALLEDNVYVQFLGVVCVEIVTLGLLYRVYKYSKSKVLPAIGLARKPAFSDVQKAAMTYGVYFVGFIVLAVVSASLFPALDIDQQQSIGFESPKGAELLAVFASLVILPPLVEEILFRGVLYQRLRRFIGLRSAAVVSSLIFAAAHLEVLGGGKLNFIAALDTLLLSFFLIYLLEKTKSLWASIFLHAIKNAVAFTFLFVIA